MRDRILKVLEKLAIDKYIIEENKNEGVELYFIKKKLDMRRMTQSREITVTVYKDFEEQTESGTKKFRGSSKCMLYPSMTQEEMERSLADAYLAAGFVKNQFYEMPAGEKKAHVTVESRIGEKGLTEAARELTEAFFAEDRDSEAFLNTLELFVTKSDRTIVSSFGADVGYTKWKIRGEFVAQALKPQDVETYRGFKYDDIDVDAIRDNVRRTFEMTKARARAEESPKSGTYDLIISGQYVKDFLNFFSDRADAWAIYPGYSDYRVGTKAQGEKIEGDALTITLKSSVPFSGEGIPMKDTKLLEDGDVKSIVGTSRFCYYLGVEPTGYFDTMEVKKGSTALADMKKNSCLHVVNFSDFDMDYMTGDFGGEVRLGFMCKDGKETPMTHFSVSGNLFDVLGKIRFSSDGLRESGYDGPLAVMIPGVAVAGD